jgi:uncharacterized CHY-type Zn-finger protein
MKTLERAISAMLPTTNDSLEWALYYHSRGWSVIPVNPQTKKPCLETWKCYQTERPTEQDLREWFGSEYKAMAVICGAVSGNLAALDFDSQERCEWWRTTHPDLARKLPTEATTRGSHVLFQCQPVRTQRRHEYGVELLCRGAYVILTPSPGKRWLNPPNGEIPKIDPFSLGLEAFGIERPGSDTSQFTEETEEPEDREETEEKKEIACASSVSSVNTRLTSEELLARIDEAITKTLPTDTGQRDRCIFTFCQWLKAIPELRERTAAQLKPVVKQWHARAYPVIGTKAFEVTWQDFVYAWARVKWPKGILLGPAVQKAHEDTQNPPEAADYEDPRTRLLVRVCWQLQQVHGDQPFYLSLRTAGELLGLSHTEASKRLEMLMADGILAIASAHTNIFATRYRYIGRQACE